MTQTAPRQHVDAAPISTDRLKAFIETRLRRREAPEQIAAAVHAYFGVTLDADQVVPYWRGEIALPTQTEHRQDKESVQLPADQPPEPNFTRMADAETPDPMPVFSIAPDPAPASGRSYGEDAPTTQTGRRQDAESRKNADSLQIPADPVDEPSVTREARHAAIDALSPW